MSTLKLSTHQLRILTKHQPHKFAYRIYVANPPLHHQHQQRRLQSSYPSATITPSKPSTQNGNSPAVTQQHTKLPPHSLLPTKMLLRSSLVSTISSSPLLLRISLSFMLYLTKKPSFLFDVTKNPLLHALLKKTFYEHFCAGENRAEVTSTITSLREIGFKGVILTYAREVVVDEKTMQERGVGAQKVVAEGQTEEVEEKDPDIETWRSGVLQTLDMIGEKDFLALKFTGAGAQVTMSLRSPKTNPLPKPFTKTLEEICSRALERNVRILVDAEQTPVQPAIDSIAIDLMRKYNKSQATIYNTYQMYLKSSTTNLNNHLHLASKDNFRLGVKMVRGAYINSEPRDLVHDTKDDTDHAFNDSLEAMLQSRFLESSTSPSGNSKSFPHVNLFVASHNKDSALKAVEWYQDRKSSGLPTVAKIEYGQLLGMADEVSCELLQMRNSDSLLTVDQEGGNQKGHTARPEVYKCLSWGTLEDCLSYLTRRAVENRDAVSRTKSEAIATRKEVWRRMKSSLGLA